MCTQEVSLLPARHWRSTLLLSEIVQEAYSKHEQYCHMNFNVAVPKSLADSPQSMRKGVKDSEAPREDILHSTGQLFKTQIYKTYLVAFQLP